MYVVDLLRLGDLTEHGAKEQLGGLADGGEHGTRVGDARARRPRRLALQVDLSARDAQTVDAVGEDRDDLLHVGLRSRGSPACRRPKDRRRGRDPAWDPNRATSVVASDPKAMAIVRTRLTIIDRREPTFEAITYLSPSCERRHRLRHSGTRRDRSARDRRGDEVELDAARGAQGHESSVLFTTVPTKPPIVWARSPTSTLLGLLARGLLLLAARTKVEEVEPTEDDHIENQGCTDEDAALRSGLCGIKCSFTTCVFPPSIDKETLVVAASRLDQPSPTRRNSQVLESLFSGDATPGRADQEPFASRNGS